MKRICFCIAICLMLSTFVAFGRFVDPTRPIDSSSYSKRSGRQRLEVSAILNSKYRKVVVVEGKSLHVGDSIGDIKVVAIYQHSVKFKDSEGAFTVLLHQDIGKKDVNKDVKKGIK